MSTRKPTTRTGSTPRAGGRVRAFTIVELLVSILVIAILIGILIVAVRQIILVARRGGEQQQVSSMQAGIGVFQQTFDNRLPPLVYDGDPIALPSGGTIPRIPGGLTTGPVFRPGGTQPPVVATLDRIFQDGGAALLNGRPLPSAGGQGATTFFDPLRDPRYSKFALPIFLTGVLPEDADGTGGPGLRLAYSQRQGWLIGGGSPQRESMYQAAREGALVSSYASIDEYQEHGQGGGGVLPAAATALNTDRSAFVNGAGTAIRYYRWEPFNPNDVPQGSDEGTLGFLNLPLVLRDPRDWDAPDEPGERIPQEYRSARYAIVSAGPNGVFGTEPVALLRTKLRVGAGLADDQVRYEAWRDNVVVVGRGNQ